MRSLNLADFIRRSKQIHGESTYDYENVVLINTKVKITLKCNVCLNTFEVTPNNHLNPNNLTGCKKCGHQRGALLRSSQHKVHTKLRLTLEQYLKRVKERHNEHYDLSEVVYSKMDERVIVKCNKHKTYSTPTAKNFLIKGSCKECANDRLRKINVVSFEEFDRRSDIIHGINRYKRNRSSYVMLTKNVTIQCLKCELIFEQRASHHVKGQGCPECNHRCFVSKGETSWLNSLLIPSNCRNIWIRLSSGQRVNVDALVENTVYEYYGTNIHGDPRKHAATDWSNFLGKTYGEAYRDTIIREELLRSDGFSIIAMWELDWKTSKV